LTNSFELPLLKFELEYRIVSTFLQLYQQYMNIKAKNVNNFAKNIVFSRRYSV